MTTTSCRQGTSEPSRAGITSGSKPLARKSATVSLSCFVVLGFVDVRMKTVALPEPIAFMS